MAGASAPPSKPWPREYPSVLASDCSRSSSTVSAAHQSLSARPVAQSSGASTVPAVASLSSGPSALPSSSVKETLTVKVAPRVSAAGTS